MVYFITSLSYIKYCAANFQHFGKKLNVSILFRPVFCYTRLTSRKCLLKHLIIIWIFGRQRFLQLDSIHPLPFYFPSSFLFHLISFPICWKTQAAGMLKSKVMLRGCMWNPFGNVEGVSSADLRIQFPLSHVHFNLMRLVR